MRSLSFTQLFLILFVAFFALFVVSVIGAWTGPTQAPPNGNVPAPVNVGSVSQIKNGSLGVNSLAVFGSALLSGNNRYLNFGSNSGSSGYGFRDSGGTMQYKNANGSWAAFGSGGGGGGGGGALTQSDCAWTVWFRVENGISPQIAPEGHYIAGIDYQATTGGADGRMRFYHCASS